MDSEPIRIDIGPGKSAPHISGSDVVLTGMMNTEGHELKCEGNLRLQDFDFYGYLNPKGWVRVTKDEKGRGGNLVLEESVRFRGSPGLYLEADESIDLKITSQNTENIGALGVFAPKIEAMSLKYYPEIMMRCPVVFAPSMKSAAFTTSAAASIHPGSSLSLSGHVPGNMEIRGFETVSLSDIGSITHYRYPNITCQEFYAKNVDGLILKACKVDLKKMRNWLTVEPIGEDADIEICIGSISGAADIYAPGAKLVLETLPKPLKTPYQSQKHKIDIGKNGELHINESEPEKLNWLKEYKYLEQLEVTAGKVFIDNVEVAPLKQTFESLRRENTGKDGYLRNS